MLLTWSHDHVGSDTKSKVIYKVFYKPSFFPIGYCKNIAAHIPCLYCMTNSSAARLFCLECQSAAACVCVHVTSQHLLWDSLGCTEHPALQLIFLVQSFRRRSLPRGCSFLTHFALHSWLSVFITLQWLIVLLMITTLYGQGSRLRSARRPGVFSLRSLDGRAQRCAPSCKVCVSIIVMKISYQ